MFENKTAKLRICSTKFNRIVECGAVQKCVSLGRSRQELSNEYLLFTCKIWRRYSRERASQSLPKIRQNFKLGKKLEKT